MLPGTQDGTAGCALYGVAEMAYDEDLANRVREQLAGEEGLTEKAMFGGLAFLLCGNMAVGLSSGGELMVRVGPDGTDDALARPHTRLFDMTGRPMKGWILVAPKGVRTSRQLAAWVRRGVEFARTLPPKG
jgi:TfoX/Sxy family transcriptional regulator of competence genes